MRTRMADYLLEVAGARRTPELNRHLALLLALVAGILNSVGFVAVSVYTSHMTGLTATVADAIVLWRPAVVLSGVIAIASFVAGAMGCALIFNWGRRRGLHSRYANVLLVEGGMMLLFGLLAEALTWEYRHLVFIAVLCFTMGLQNATITKISGATIRTTHVTGMVTDIGIELGKMAYRNRLADADPVVGDRTKLTMHASLVGLFFLGGMIGAAGYLWIGFVFLVPTALVLLVATYRPLADDVRTALLARRRAGAADLSSGPDRRR
ncbi:YoaK family protein [Raineyella sp.]|uniref:DUF1275 domain-containing protein n=1 Tax=bioreactor metagenome TaxID=1076179 RepID=A0A645A889_9ZZZZ|nr:YoaK family protein [Raineyella sp.]MEA5154344.1 YoaK family protein [Raineyella sp.]